MSIGLDGIVLGRQAVGVKADREQDIVALHAAFAGHDLEARVGLDVSDVHAGARRIRELDKAVELRLFGEVDGMEHTGVFPLVLPFFLDRFKVVGFHFSTVLYVKIVCYYLIHCFAPDQVPQKSSV